MSRAMFRELAIDLINAERRAQNEKWGEDRVLPRALWLAILAEEFGEVAEEVVESTTRAGEQPISAEQRGRLIAELVQVAAVSVSWLEQLLEETTDD